MKRMVLSFRDALRKRGLRLHPTKCKAQTNLTGARGGSIQTAEAFALNVMEEHNCSKVLGTHLSLLDVAEAELEHRIAVAWRKFWALKALLLNNKVFRNGGCNYLIVRLVVVSCSWLMPGLFALKN